MVKNVFHDKYLIPDTLEWKNGIIKDYD